jgi:hypothetical protein
VADRWEKAMSYKTHANGGRKSYSAERREKRGEGKPRGRGRCGCGGCRREESYAVAFDARDQVVSVGQQPANNLAGGIVGVGHEVERLLQSQ